MHSRKWNPAKKRARVERSTQLHECEIKKKSKEEKEGETGREKRIAVSARQGDIRRRFRSGILSAVLVSRDVITLIRIIENAAC